MLLPGRLRGGSRALSFLSGLRGRRRTPLSRSAGRLGGSTNTNTETGNDPAGQLYDLARDPGERENLAARHPDRVKEMAAQLERIKQAGRSRRCER